MRKHLFLDILLKVSRTHIRITGQNRCTIQRRFCHKGFKDLQRLSIMYLDMLISVQSQPDHKNESVQILTRADLSLLLVIQYVLSLLNWRSVTVSPCALSLLFSSSPLFTSNNATLPDSWPVKMTPGALVNAQTVAFEPIGLKK